jgi:hypothetical protein
MKGDRSGWTMEGSVGIHGVVHTAQDHGEGVAWMLKRFGRGVEGCQEDGGVGRCGVVETGNG